MSTIIPAGYEVRDEAGNLVAVAVRDLAKEDLIKAESFVNYAGVPFQRNTIMPKPIFLLLDRVRRGELIISP